MTTNIQNNQNIDNVTNDDSNINEEQEKHIFFHDEYLLEDTDKKLIDVESVESQVKKMLDNYSSEEYKNYNIILDKIPKIFGKKSFVIDYKKESIKIYKVKKDGDKELIHNIIKPVIQDIIDFKHTIYDINYSRDKLKKEYLEYITEDNVSLADKNKFIKDKKSFIELLETYYTHKNYYMIINNLLGSEKFKNISISNYLPFLKSNGEYDNKLFFSQYKINPEVIEEINQSKIKNLDVFNNIKENMQLNNKKELHELIKSYLNKEDSEINKKINKVIKEQNEEILYTINRIPKIDSSLNKYID
jgi:hypothetical protein